MVNFTCRVMRIFKASNLNRYYSMVPSSSRNHKTSTSFNAQFKLPSTLQSSKLFWWNRWQVQFSQCHAKRIRHSYEKGSKRHRHTWQMSGRQVVYGICCKSEACVLNIYQRGGLCAFAVKSLAGTGARYLQGFQDYRRSFRPQTGIRFCWPYCAFRLIDEWELETEFQICEVHRSFNISYVESPREIWQSAWPESWLRHR